MANEQHAHDDMNAFEAALAGLAPLAGRLDRDRLLFLAGQAAAGVSPAIVADSSPARGRRGWPAAFAAMTAIAAGLLIALVMRPPQPVERQAEAPPGNTHERLPTPADRPQTAALLTDTPDSYVHLRNLVYAQGLDAWPASSAIAASGGYPSTPLRPASLGALLHELQDQPEASSVPRPETSPESNSLPGEKS